jgi:hypothetical protein
MRLTDHITLDLKNTMSVAAVFFEKAFDTTYHLALIYKLSTLKFSISLLKLISCFLSQRKFRVSVEGETSVPRDTQAGMLLVQGSILSPTLYSVHINDTSKTLGVCL